MTPGGSPCRSEWSTPTPPLDNPLSRSAPRHIIPLAGRIVSRDVRAYSYLPESIAAVPQGESMLALMREAGFSATEHHPLTFGVCTIYIARK